MYTSSTTTVHFPEEIIHAVVEETWKSSMSKDERWDLYHLLAESHPLIHLILLSVATRRVYLTLDHSRKDVDLCKLIAAQSASLSSQGFSYLQGKKTYPSRSELDAAGSSAHWHSILQRAHVHYDLTLLIGSRDRYTPSISAPGWYSINGDLIEAVSIGRHGQFFSWPSYTRSLHSIFSAECPVASVTAYSRTPVACERAWLPLEMFSKLFPVATHVFLQYRIQTLEQSTDVLAAFPSLGASALPWLTTFNGFSALRTAAALSRPSAITYLRLEEVPTCRCPLGQVHKANCVQTLFFMSVPNVRHLHINTPISLSHLSLPHTLETLTLEAPSGRIFGGKPFSTLLGYNICEALDKGLLQWSQGRAPRRAILLRTGTTKPLGLQGVQAACAKHGIMLRNDGGCTA
ncbi:hypothetical protein C8Q76DRAFT_427403 [Earliella scabrosa]|nr:hypothetical protein C8Q76DRAFT_427403 [Earliella scabrosa]